MTRQEQLKQAWYDGFNKTAAGYLTPDVLRGAAMGAPLGAGLAGLYGFLKPSPPERGVKDPRLLRALRYALMGGLAGGVGGGAAGRFSPEDIQQLARYLQTAGTNLANIGQ